MDRKEAGRKGGEATVEKHGSPHMKAIAAKGFAATVNRHWGGSKDEYLANQRKRAWEKGVGGYVDKLLQDQLDSGQEVASVELPVVFGPDDDASWTERVAKKPRGRMRA